MPWKRLTLLVILGYEAVGCLMGGTMLVIAPDGSLMDMPVSMMRGAFNDFLLPGILLFGLGICNTAAFIAVWCRNGIAWNMAAVAIGGLLIWFLVELAILRQLHWLHAMWGLPVVLGGFIIIATRPGRRSC